MQYQSAAEIKPVLREIKPGHRAACIRIGPEEPDIEVVVQKKYPGAAARDWSCRMTPGILRWRGPMRRIRRTDT